MIWRGDERGGDKQPVQTGTRSGHANRAESFRWQQCLSVTKRTPGVVILDKCQLTLASETSTRQRAFPGHVHFQSPEDRTAPCTRLR